MGTSSQDGSTGGLESPLYTTTSKLQLKYKTTITQNHQNLVEWKPNNYGIKETTSIQTGRRGADVE